MTNTGHSTMKDAEGNTLAVGCICLYQPDVMELMYGEVPERFHDELCQVKGFVPTLGVLVKFDGSRHEYKVSRDCLTMQTDIGDPDPDQQQPTNKQP